MRIAVGLSGGVDSSVVAYLLKKEGHDVVGVNMNLFPDSDISEDTDAKKVADFLGIDYVSINMEKEYQEKVVQYIRNEYLSGRTPNPCIICNRFLKFGLFLEKVLQSGYDFDMFATGHYALIEKDDISSRFMLKKGSHTDKDQAYFLSMLTQEQLSKILFPLGNMIKKDVKAIAEEVGLFTAKKKESQDLCSGDYRKFIESNGKTGFFITKSGENLGAHQGIENYTIGQRRGLGLSSSGEPYYVVAIDAENNNVIVGYNKDLLSSSMIVGAINWGAITEPELPYPMQVKIRYRDDGIEGTIEKKLENDRYLISFSRERRAVTPGQLAVFYDNDTVVGAAFIEASRHVNN
ncbi:MAG: tRNA 2-thiouridine(34) synthase MnmA [Deltaproteobacteria bacterium]|nr:tRNA 2-thiouridine(34) synthase MnmA [Deltaproteobacteria bacterium]